MDVAPQMEGPLAGRLILIAEDEVLIALDITKGLEGQGARVIQARNLVEALRCVEESALSTAILDHALSDGDSSAVCTRMNERGIPFITYSGYSHLKGPCSNAVHVKKPAGVPDLIEAVIALLADRPKRPIK